MVTCSFFGYVVTETTCSECKHICHICISLRKYCSNSVRMILCWEGKKTPAFVSGFGITVITVLLYIKVV